MSTRSDNARSSQALSGSEQSSQAAPRDAVGPVAFFDLDGTLVVGQTQFLLVKFLRQAGVVSGGFLIGAGTWFLAYKAGLVKATDASRRKGAAVLRGLEEHEAEVLMERFAAEELMPRLFPRAVAALQEHQAAGDRVVVLSAALEPLVRAFCARLGVSWYAGAACEVRDGVLTGLIKGPIPYGEEKARLARCIASEWAVDLADCWAYGDHDTDISLLESVGHPVAVRPRPGLRAVAERAGWPILA